MKSFLLVVLICCGLLLACNQQASPVIVPTLITSATPSPTATLTATPTPLPTSTPTPTPSPTLTPSATATDSRPPSYTPSPTFSPTPSPTLPSNITPSATPILPTLAPQLFDTLREQVDIRSMMETIQRLTQFGNRYTNSAVGDGTTGIYAARDYLKGRMTAQQGVCTGTANFYEDMFTMTFQQIASNQANLVLEVVGTDRALPVIVVGAHYDTDSKFPRSDRNFPNQPGADDNGSGVSAVLELSRLICLEPRQRTFVFVLFAAEEVSDDGLGRSGSRNFVSAFVPQRGWQIGAMLNLDTIGSATDSNGTFAENLARLYSAPPNDSPSRQLARQVQAAAYSQLPTLHLNVENTEDRQNRWGDHMSFTRLGYPAVRLLEGAEDTVRQDTNRDLLNDIDPTYLGNNMLAILAYLLSRSEGAAPPANITTRNNFIFWDEVTQALGYLVAYRRPTDTNYSFIRVTADQTATELPLTDVWVAVGTIASNGILGPMTAEFYVSP